MTQNPEPSFELPRRVAILIPTHCRNHKLIPETHRSHVQKMVRREMRKCSEPIREKKSRWRMVTFRWNADARGRAYHLQPRNSWGIRRVRWRFQILAKNVADLLAQEEVAISVDNKMFWFSETPKYSGTGTEQLKGWVPKQSQFEIYPQRNKSILFINIAGEVPNSRPFRQKLHYDYANEPLSTKNCRKV